MRQANDGDAIETPRAPMRPIPSHPALRRAVSMPPRTWEAHEAGRTGRVGLAVGVGELEGVVGGRAASLRDFGGACMKEEKWACSSFVQDRRGARLIGC